MNKNLLYVLQKLMRSIPWESIKSTDFVFLVGLYLGFRVIISSSFLCGFLTELSQFLGFAVLFEVFITTIRRVPWRDIKSNKLIFLVAFYFILRVTISRWFLFLVIKELAKFMGFSFLVDVLVIWLAKILT